MRTDGHVADDEIVPEKIAKVFGIVPHEATEIPDADVEIIESAGVFVPGRSRSAA